MNWNNVKVFIGGIELKSVKSVSFTRPRDRHKGVNVCSRIKTVAEIVLKKQNLN